jgi:hypothetical protein
VHEHAKRKDEKTEAAPQGMLTPSAQPATASSKAIPSP